MAATLVAADLDLAADVCLDLATEVTLDLEVGFDRVAELDQLFVVRVVDGAAQIVAVEVVVQAGDRALVRGEGLTAGQRVVTRGNERLRPGEAVTEGTEAAAAPAAAGGGA